MGIGGGLVANVGVAAGLGVDMAVVEISVVILSGWGVSATLGTGWSHAASTIATARHRAAEVNRTKNRWRVRKEIMLFMRAWPTRLIYAEKLCWHCAAFALERRTIHSFQERQPARPRRSTSN